jgi:hypothetical protein
MDFVFRERKLLVVSFVRAQLKMADYAGETTHIYFRA